MARTLNGSSQYLSTGIAHLSQASQFTICFWFRPASLDTSSTAKPILFSSDGTDSWGIYQFDAAVLFSAVNYTGVTNPATNAFTEDMVDIDTTHGKRVLFRYKGTADEWAVWTGSRTGGLVKKTINASASFGLPNLTGGIVFRVGYDGTNYAAGGIAEVALYNVALTDADCELLLRGVAADQVARASLVNASLGNSGYWPLRGTGYEFGGTTYEPNYAKADLSLVPLTPNGSPPAEAHPPVYGRDDQTDMHAAWCAEIQHADGTIYAASRDLSQPLDVDVLGRAYPERILNGDSVVVAKTINEGIVSPGSTTLVLANDTARSPYDVRGLVAWLEADQIRTVADAAAVTTWPDVSGSGLDATGGTGPTFDADGMNSKPALLFDAGGEHLTLPSTTATSGSAAYTIVCAFTRADAVAATHTLLCDSGGGWILYTNNSNQLVADFSASPTTVDTTAVTVDATNIASYVYTGASVFARLNQGAWATGTPTKHPDPIRIGANSGGALELDGRVAAVLVYNRALGTEELERVENYLAAKYGSASTPHGMISPRREFRGTRVILRRYERTSHELVTELVGKIADVDWSRPGVAAVTITGAATDVLDERIPKALVNVDEHATATDLLAPIPVGFGEFWVSAPYIGRDESTSPGEADFVVCHLEDADAADMTVRVERVLFDIVPGFPGLEEVTSWYEVGGTTPTRVSNTVLQLSADYERFYEVGMPVRVTVSGTAYYSHVTAYTGGGTNQVTIADAIVTTHPTKVEVLAGGYLIQTSEYQSGTSDLVTVRFIGTGFGGGAVVEATQTSIQNPANVIKEMLRNSVWSVGQTVDSALFTQAATDFSDAGLATACNYALAGDRQQRTLRNVLGELLSLRGAWLDLQSDGSWGIYVDKAPAWEQSRTFTCGDRRFPQIQRINAHARTPLGSSIGELKLRYSKKGRSRTNDGVTSWIAPNDYEYQVNYSTGLTGADRVITNPWIDRFAHAGRVVVYQGKRLAAEDERLDVTVGPEGRNVELGEIVRLVVPHSQVDADFRVVGYTRGLGSTVLRTVGYDAGIFSYSSGEVSYDDGSGTNTQGDGRDRDETAKGDAVGPNQVLNANFALGLGNTYTPAATVLDATTLPGWLISEGDGGSTAISALSISRNEKWTGTCYVQLTIANTAGTPQLRTNSRIDATYTQGGMLVEAGKAYIVSAYVTETSATKPADARGFYFTIEYFQTDGTSISTDTPKIRSTGELTGPSTERVMRWWGVTRAPTAAAYAQLNIIFDATGTYQVGAVSFNKVNRFIYKPPPWANAAYES